jgi:hypothetical protein
MFPSTRLGNAIIEQRLRQYRPDVHRRIAEEGRRR